jgi:hypothetical protein
MKRNIASKLPLGHFNFYQAQIERKLVVAVVVAKKWQPCLAFGQVKIIAIKKIHHSRNNSFELIGSWKTVLLTQ